ncbi:MAG: DUF167 domain-containing protein [Halofilum sp. (in: g-proteobacteria)]
MKERSPGAWCRWDGADLLLELRVIPRSKDTALAGIRQGRLLLRLQAPPVDGKANAAIERWFANLFGVGRGAVTIEAGIRGRDKRLRIERPARLPAELIGLAADEDT